MPSFALLLYRGIFYGGFVALCKQKIQINEKKSDFFICTVSELNLVYSHPSTTLLNLSTLTFEYVYVYEVLTFFLNQRRNKKEDKIESHFFLHTLYLYVLYNKLFPPL